MQKKEHINIRVSLEELRAGLQKMIRSEHSSLISKVIIDNLSVTEVGLQQLYRAMSGVSEKFKYKTLDEVSVKYDALSTWRMDKEKMKEANLIFQDHVNGTVTEVDPQRSQPYHINYECIDSKGARSKEDSWVSEEYIKPFLSSSDILVKDQEDLPF